MKNSHDSSSVLSTGADNGSGFGFLMQELDRLFDFPARTGSSHQWSPVSAHETETGYRYDLELPGLKKDELKVTLTDGVLAVKGRKKVFRGGEETWVEMERSLLVPEDVDPHKVRAQYVDGILTLEIPKREEVKPTTIDIQVS